MAEREGLSQTSCPRDSRYLAEASVQGFAVVLRQELSSLQVWLFSQVKHHCELEPGDRVYAAPELCADRRLAVLCRLLRLTRRQPLSASAAPLPGRGSLAAAVLLTRKGEDVAKKLWLLALRRDSRRRFLDRAPSSPSPGPRVVMHARQLFWTAASAKSVATAWVQVSQTHHPGLAAQQANVTFGVLTLGVWQLWAIASLQMERLRLAAPRTSDGSGQEG